MRGMRLGLLALALAASAATVVSAQQTSGNVNGRVLDQQQAAIPGVTVTATNGATGFARTATTDDEGMYRLPALPVGTYELKVELTGFQPLTRQIEVAVGANLDVNFDLTMQSVTEAIQVTGETPLIEVSTSSVGGVVDTRRIESMPLNGRQFANLAATIPGVGLGMHTDPTKSTQFAPQIGGGNGRNLNYQIDGGDNNDDTVGGLLQLFPLEAIDQFSVITSRYKAEYGRSNGGVMNIVTKSGTNELKGSWFTLFRDDWLNARTETERLTKVPKGDYRRYQYGGSVGGPIVKNKLQYFGAFERTQQDTFQTVSTLGLFPELDGRFALPYRETLVTGKVSAYISDSNYLWVRYGRNENSQPYNAGPLRAPNAWGDSGNTFNSINGNYNLLLGSALNELIFQYADFRNHIDPTSFDTRETFPNGVQIGQHPNTPQTTEQKKWQFRDDFSWQISGRGGIGHSMKAGVNWIHEPRLFITFNGGKGVVQYAHVDNTRTGALSRVLLNDGNAEANIPLDQYAFYVQDDWKLASRLTLNVGLRYDYIDGYQIDQSRNPNFVKLQEAGRAGLLAGIRGLENFGQDPKNDSDNWQPRVGFAWDVRGTGRDVVRGGWGVYQDVGYTNANVLFPASDASGSFGAVFDVNVEAGIRNPDGSFYQIGQPLSNIASQNGVNLSVPPLFGQVLDPRHEMPYTRQFAVGWSHELSSSSAFTVDYVNNQGRDLNTRPRINVFQNPGGPVRRLAFLALQPNVIGTRAASSFGRSEYQAMILGFKRRMHRGIDLTATYTLAKAHSTIGSAVDELNANNLQDATLLYEDPRVDGPTTNTDARHATTIAGVFQVKGGFTVASIFIFRSALPVPITEGIDLNKNSENNDLPATAYAFDGVNDDGTARVKEIGACETWACGRGAKQSQFNMRVTKGFTLRGTMRIEAIAEVFNLFNAKNPAAFTAQRLVGTGAGTPNTRFMQPGAYSGDFQQPDQRIGQIGFRFVF